MNKRFFTTEKNTAASHTLGQCCGFIEVRAEDVLAQTDPTPACDHMVSLQPHVQRQTSVLHELDQKKNGAGTTEPTGALQLGFALEEARDGVETLVRRPALHQSLHLSVVHGVQTLLLCRADQLLRQSQRLRGEGGVFQVVLSAD